MIAHVRLVGQVSFGGFEVRPHGCPEEVLPNAKKAEADERERPCVKLFLQDDFALKFMELRKWGTDTGALIREATEIVNAGFVYAEGNLTTNAWEMDSYCRPMVPEHGYGPRYVEVTEWRPVHADGWDEAAKVAKEQGLY